MIASAGIRNILVPVLLAVAVTVIAPRSASAVVPGSNGRIVFVAIPDNHCLGGLNNGAVCTAASQCPGGTCKDDDDLEIFTTEADGGDVQQLTTNLADEYSPVWSPDGTKIAFSSNVSGDYEIHVMDADGSNDVSLTKTPGIDETPAWSPDGKKIAFASARDGGPQDLAIWVMNANGTGQTKLTTLPGSEIFPNWSPDGNRIAFEKQGTGFQVYVMNANGSNPVNLTAAHGGINSERQPMWSPDGQLLAYYGQVGFQNDLFTMKPDGSQPTNLSNSPNANDYQPVFSPDGTKIVFVSNRDVLDADNIWVMDANGDNPVRITDTSIIAESPDWQPASGEPPVNVERPKKIQNDLIVFSSDRTTPTNPEGDAEIFVMTAIGTKLKQLTVNSGLADREPAWSPFGRKIAFSRLADGTDNSDIFTMNPDGTLLKRLTSSIEPDHDPSWSPNARRIAWVRRVIKGASSDTDILAMDVDGANKVNLTDPLGVGNEDEESPTWGVDSRRLAFVRHLGGVNPDIFIMDADGANQVNVTNTPAGTEEIEAAWAPNGKKIAFARRDGTSFPFYEIWTINPDGTGLTQITSSFEGGGRVNASLPAWAPDSRWLVYNQTVSPPDGLQTEIITIKADGSAPATLESNPALDDSPDWALR